MTPVTCSLFSPYRVDPVPHDAPKPPGYTRFVCVSDTHSRTDPIQMPYGDVLIHAGDFTELGLPSEVKKFNEWLGRSCMLSTLGVLGRMLYLELPSPIWVSSLPCPALPCPAPSGSGPIHHLGEPSLPSQTLLPSHLGPPFPTLILTLTCLLVFGHGDPPKGAWLPCVWSTCVFRPECLA